MKFKGPPLHAKIDYKAHKTVCIFDKNGIGEVNNPIYAERMKQLGYEVYDAEKKSPEAKTAEAKTTVRCKHCGEEIEKKLLLAHYNQNHRGEKK